MTAKSWPKFDPKLDGVDSPTTPDAFLPLVDVVSNDGSHNPILIEDQLRPQPLRVLVGAHAEGAPLLRDMTTGNQSVSTSDWRGPQAPVALPRRQPEQTLDLSEDPEIVTTLTLCDGSVYAFDMILGVRPATGIGGVNRIEVNVAQEGWKEHSYVDSRDRALEVVKYIGALMRPGKTFTGLDERTRPGLYAKPAPAINQFTQRTFNPDPYRIEGAANTEGYGPTVVKTAAKQSISQQLMDQLDKERDNEITEAEEAIAQILAEDDETSVVG